MTMNYLALIVEDEDFLIRALQDNLTPRGCRIAIAHDGEEALAYLATHTPDIIVLDLLMPKRDGFYVLSQMKETDKWKDIPVLVLSNLGEPHDIQKAMDLGADDYFVKSHNTIIEVINRIMDMLEKNKANSPPTNKKRSNHA